MICLDSNRNWALSDGSLELLRIIWSYVDERRDLNFTLTFLVLAFAVMSLVGVLILSFEGLSLCISEGLIHPATIAAHISLGS